MDRWQTIFSPSPREVVQMIKEIFFIEEKVTLETKHSPMKCLELLMNHQRKDVICSFEQNGFRMYEKRSRSLFRNGAPNYYGVIKPLGEGARMEGYFGYSPSAPIVQWIFLLACGLILGFVFWGLPQNLPMIGWVYFILFAGIIFWIFSNRIGYFLYASSKDTILSHLEKNLEAHLAQTDHSSRLGGLAK